MEDGLEPCRSCARHVRAGERSCPFCNAPRLIGGVAAVVAALATAATLAACYGCPPPGCREGTPSSGRPVSTGAESSSPPSGGADGGSGGAAPTSTQ